MPMPHMQPPPARSRYSLSLNGGRSARGHGSFKYMRPASEPAPGAEPAGAAAAAAGGAAPTAPGAPPAEAPAAAGHGGHAAEQPMAE